MARNSENLAGAISAVNGIVGAQTEALAQIKTTLARKAAGTTDISLGITSAAVGDIVKVKAVDADGKPTEWEAAGWRKIREFTLPDDPSIDTSDISYSMCNMEGYTDKIAQAIFSTDDEGNSFDVQDIFLVANWGYSRSNNYYGMSDQNGDLGYGNIFSNRLSNGALWKIAYLSIRINNYRYAFRGGNANAMDIMGIMHTSPNVKDDLRITTIKIGTFLDQAMLPGSSFIVYGR